MPAHLARLADSPTPAWPIWPAHRTLPRVVNAITQALDDHGEVKDSASPTLARIRREIDVTHSRLMEKLNRMLASSTVNQYLQESIITQRAGRYVLPVKADFKGRVSGVVHDQSASGATIFVEPLATVELNNQWRHLQVQEQDEIRKIWPIWPNRSAPKASSSVTLCPPWPTLTWPWPKPNTPTPSTPSNLCWCCPPPKNRAMPPGRLQIAGRPPPPAQPPNRGAHRCGAGR